MFEKLGRAFREAYDNFKEELDRDAVPETVDRLLKNMHDEAAEVHVNVQRLEADIKKALVAAEKEQADALTCRRREEMANKVGDEETARIAAEYAVKHEQHAEILGRKALAMKDELNLQKAEYEEMLAAIKNAKASRNSLSAQAGRAQARNSMSGANELFDRLDQMEAELDGTDHVKDAEREIDDYLRPDNENHIRFDEPIRDREAEAEDKLERLKRMMGREDD